MRARVWRDHTGLWRYSVPFAFDLVHGAAGTWRAAYTRTRRLVEAGPHRLPEDAMRLHRPEAAVTARHSPDCIYSGQAELCDGTCLRPPADQCAATRRREVDL